MRRLLSVCAAVGALGLGGCTNYLRPLAVHPARPGLESVRHRVVAALPPPQEKVVVAVYRFRDQTGQYKMSDQVASWSTAVTQGATSILMRALETSGWFVPIEREGLSNLLNERQIINQTRAQHTGPDGQPLGALPPLLYAGVMLEGGIVGYDSNVLTGGVGVRYFGAGGSGQFRQDQVTVYLRAVSTQTGRVLKTVHTTKTIVTQKVDGGLFRYVDTRRLLETELGYSYNEPPVIAVTEAIEEAVRALVVEGVRENLWALQNPNDARGQAFAQYDRDVEDSAELNYYAQRVRADQRPGVGLSLGGGALLYQGDYKNPLATPTVDGAFRVNVAPSVALGVAGSAGRLSADRAFERSHVTGEAFVQVFPTPDRRLTPFLQAGFGVLAQTGLASGTEPFPYVSGAVGVEWMRTRRVGLSVSLGNVYPLKEGLDGVVNGPIHDNLWGLRTAFVFHPF